MKNAFYNSMLFVILLLQLTKATAQKQQLGLNDTVPPQIFENLFPQDEVGANLSGNQKIYIINFFAISCGNSIRSLVTLNKLQQLYKDQLQVVSVTAHKEEKYLKNKSARQELNDLELRVITGDVDLKKMFPFVSTPHIVVINQNRKIIGITYIEYINETAMQVLFSSGKPEWEYKNENLRYNKNQPLLTVNQIGNKFPDIRNYRAFAGYLEGLPLYSSNFFLDTVTNTKRIYLRNFEIRNLYYLSLSTKYLIPQTSFIIEVVDKDAIRFDEQKSVLYTWAKKNTYSYELVLPAETEDSVLYNTMLADLNSFFNFNGRIEKRKMDCWVLVKKGRKTNNLFDTSYVKSSITTLLVDLNKNEGALPAVNGTYLSNSTELFVKREHLDNIDLLRKDLNNQGFDLIKKKRILEVFVLSEK